MENMQSSKTFEEQSRKITLKGYYLGLPSIYAPKTKFITEVARRCRVSEQTVRNWILYNMRPQQEIHYRILSEMTGIKEEDLW